MLKLPHELNAVQVSILRRKGTRERYAKPRHCRRKTHSDMRWPDLKRGSHPDAAGTDAQNRSNQRLKQSTVETASKPRFERGDVVPIGNLALMTSIRCAGKRLKSGKQYHGHGVLNGRRGRAGVDLRADEGSPSHDPGLPVGRPKGPGKRKLGKHRPEIEALLANGSIQKFIAKRYKSYGGFCTFA